jgi:hypothetical protein
MVSEKKLGIILTSLSLTNRTRTNAGYVLWLDLETRKEIHALARAHSAKTGPAPEVAAKCNLCQVASANSANGPTNQPVEQSRQESSASGCIHGYVENVRLEPVGSARARKSGRKL